MKIEFIAVMRLGKRKDKEKDPSEVKSQGVDGITRLICLSKGQNPLKGNTPKNKLYAIFTISYNPINLSKYILGIQTYFLFLYSSY